MANLRSSKKDIRRTEKRKIINAAQRSSLRTYAKNILKSIKEGDITSAQTLFNTYSSLVDKAAKKQLIHKNNASRKKSRMAKKLLSIKPA
jgi:small subunit ribosomal protein S20